MLLLTYSEYRSFFCPLYLSCTSVSPKFHFLNTVLPAEPNVRNKHYMFSVSGLILTCSELYQTLQRAQWVLKILKSLFHGTEKSHFFKLYRYTNNVWGFSNYTLDNIIYLFTALLGILRHSHFGIKESSHILEGDHCINYASQASVSDCCEF